MLLRCFGSSDEASGDAGSSCALCMLYCMCYVLSVRVRMSGWLLLMLWGPRSVYTVIKMGTCLPYGDKAGPVL